MKKVGLVMGMLAILGIGIGLGVQSGSVEAATSSEGLTDCVKLRVETKRGNGIVIGPNGTQYGALFIRLDDGSIKPIDMNKIQKSFWVNCRDLKRWESK